MQDNLILKSQTQSQTVHSVLFRQRDVILMENTRLLKQAMKRTVKSQLGALSFDDHHLSYLFHIYAWFGARFQEFNPVIYC